MAIVWGPLDANNEEDRLVEETFVFRPLAESPLCWVCSAPFEQYPIVYYRGETYIFLHPKCSKHLGSNLIFDGTAADSPTNLLRRWASEIEKRDKKKEP